MNRSKLIVLKGEGDCTLAAGTSVSRTHSHGTLSTSVCQQGSILVRQRVSMSPCQHFSAKVCPRVSVSSSRPVRMTASACLYVCMSTRQPVRRSACKHQRVCTFAYRHVRMLVSACLQGVCMSACQNVSINMSESVCQHVNKRQSVSKSACHHVSVSARQVVSVSVSQFQRTSMPT